MAADPQLVEGTNRMIVTFLKVIVPMLVIGGIVGIALALIRRNTEEAVNRFFWRRSKTGKRCPVDGGMLMKRRGKYGTFLGCSNYPKCSYTEGGTQPK